MEVTVESVCWLSEHAVINPRTLRSKGNFFMGRDPRNKMKSNSDKPFARRMPGVLHPFWTGNADESGRISLRESISNPFDAEEAQR
jgi:hypothetical protein